VGNDQGLPLPHTIVFIGSALVSSGRQQGSGKACPVRTSLFGSRAAARAACAIHASDLTFPQDDGEGGRVCVFRLVPPGGYGGPPVSGLSSSVSPGGLLAHVRQMALQPEQWTRSNDPCGEAC
jgi:hypothetical protein